MTNFDKFWACYPVKKGKKLCKQLWVRENCEEIAQQMIDHVNLMLEKDKLWKVGIGIPHPSTYIRQERWEDEPEIEQEREKKVFIPRDREQWKSFAEQHGLPQAGAHDTYDTWYRKMSQALENRRLQ